jgi:hypothetical protein
MGKVSKKFLPNFQSAEIEMAVYVGGMETMHRYEERLRETADKMVKLADALAGPKMSRPLNAKEKQLVRLAALPMARECLDEVLNQFVVGRPVSEDEGAMDSFLEMARDLKD